MDFPGESAPQRNAAHPSHADAAQNYPAGAPRSSSHGVPAIGNGNGMNAPSRADMDHRRGNGYAFAGAQPFPNNPFLDRYNTMPALTHPPPPHHGPFIRSYPQADMHMLRAQTNEERAPTFASLSRSSIQPFTSNHQELITHDPSSELRATSAHGIHARTAGLNPPSLEEIQATTLANLLRRMRAQADREVQTSASHVIPYTHRQLVATQNPSIYNRDLLLHRDNPHAFPRPRPQPQPQPQPQPRADPEYEAVVRRLPRLLVLRPIPANYVANLPRVSTEQLGPGPYDRECPICCRNYGEIDPATGTSEHPVRLPCTHVYGQKCLADWFNSGRSDANSQCPSCRRDLTERVARVWIPALVGRQLRSMTPEQRQALGIRWVRRETVAGGAVGGEGNGASSRAEAETQRPVLELPAAGEVLGYGPAYASGAGAQLPRQGNQNANAIQSRTSERPAPNQAPELWPQAAYPVFPTAVSIPADPNTTPALNTLDIGTAFGHRNTNPNRFEDSEIEHRASWGTNGTPAVATERGSLREARRRGGGG